MRVVTKHRLTLYIETSQFYTDWYNVNERGFLSIMQKCIEDLHYLFK